MNTDDDLRSTVAPSLNDNFTIAGLLSDELTPVLAVTSSLLIPEVQLSLDTPPYVALETDPSEYNFLSAGVRSQSNTSGQVVLDTRLDFSKLDYDMVFWGSIMFNYVHVTL